MSMKVAAETLADQEQWLRPVEFTLPAGLIGFPDARRIELIFHPEELPFMWIRCVDDPSVNFIVIEPCGIVPGYTIELPEDDATRLDIRSPEDCFILNIVTFRPDAPEKATANLIGPLVVNRRTLIGRQVVIANFADYTAKHPLLAREAGANRS